MIPARKKKDSLTQIEEIVRDDANIDPEGYAADSEVPEGGE